MKSKSSELIKRNMGFPGGSVVKNLPASARDAGSTPRSRRSPAEANGNPPQHSCLGNPMDRGASRSIVHGVSRESDTTQRLNNIIMYSKSRAYKPSSCELSEVHAYIPMSNHIGWFTCPVYTAMCGHPLQMAGLLCTLLCRAQQYNVFISSLGCPEASIIAAVMWLVLLYFSRYSTLGLKAFFVVF